MKKEDFDRLKKLCQENDFEIDGYHPSSRLFIIDKKAPWDGVEYFKTPKVIFKIDRIEKGIIEYQENGITLHINTRFVHPSTESAYVEQLKKEAFERFGEIKDGDRFKSLSTGTNVNVDYKDYGDLFYSKENDSLYNGGVCIYCKGKWATRVKERVEVKPVGLSQERYGRSVLVNLTFEVNSIDFTLNGASQFLASQLEAFLNLKDCETSINGEIVSIHIKPKKGADLSKVAEKAQELANLCSD